MAVFRSAGCTWTGSTNDWHDGCSVVDDASCTASWLQVLKNDTRAIFTAASHAQRAVDDLHGLQSDATPPTFYGVGQGGEATP